jgi:hypothetical protein
MYTRIYTLYTAGDLPHSASTGGSSADRSVYLTAQHSPRAAVSLR